MIPLWNRIDPSTDELLRLATRHNDESMLLEIASADYGESVSLHLERMREAIRGKLQAPIPWEPKEVLELIRWSEPDDANWSPGGRGERGHWMRLLSCALLLNEALKPENDGYLTGEDSTIVQLLDSALELGDDVALSALRFLGDCFLRRAADDWDLPFFAIAILLLAVHLDQVDPDSEAELIKVTHSADRPLETLLSDCQKMKTWARRTDDLLLRRKNVSPELRELGCRLVNGDDAN